MTVWQIAAGDSPERYYGDLFLKYGLAAVGPGDPGSFIDKQEFYARDERAYRSFMRPFCEQIAVDDLLVLKRPVTRSEWEVIAVGRVASKYLYVPGLEDVEGWDLQHVVRVRWRIPTEPRKIFGLARGTLKRINKPELRELAQILWDDHAATEKEPDELPAQPSKMTDEVLISLLIDKGVSSMVAETTAATVRRLRRLADWYSRRGGDIGEHEIRTFLVTPLLLALGWPEQRVRIEYKRADIALWDKPFDQRGALVERIVETKRLYHALGDGPAVQAAAYAAGHPSCRALIVTDGFRYKLLQKSPSGVRGHGWAETAYANLLKLRVNHPLDPNINGAGALFLAMLP